jgi:hypothetical protein
MPAPNEGEEWEGRDTHAKRSQNGVAQKVQVVQHGLRQNHLV